MHARMRPIWTSLLLLAVTLSGCSCGEDAPGSCKTQADCMGVTMCVSGQCVSPQLLDVGVLPDAEPADLGAPDLGAADAGFADVGFPDVGFEDVGFPDAGFADAGFPVMNQTVLLRGVNDDASVLEALFRGLVRARVRPYYLLQADPVRGTGHLRTPLAKGVAILAALQGRLSGIALPKLVCDTPGGLGKVPLSPDYVVSRQPGRTVLRTFRGDEVAYLDPP